jgi:hypothetical protein
MTDEIDMSDPESIEPHILTTQGVTSEVRHQGAHAGHVLLLDYDEGTTHRTLREYTASLPGVSILWESSPESWHVWNLTVRGREQTALAMLDLHCDPRHVPIGYRRRRWTLRIGPKTRQNSRDRDTSGPYKSPPEPMDVWVNSTDRNQSRPHFRLARARLDDDQRDRLDRLAQDKGLSFMGDCYRAEEYTTVTDALKRGMDS